MTTEKKPDVQLIANLVVRRRDGAVLFVRYDPDDERWWLPGQELEPYEHPDDVAKRAAADLAGLRAKAPVFSHVESFRGRRGWHVVFHYRVDAAGTPSGALPAAWHAADALPRTVHGAWERAVVRRVLANPRRTSRPRA
jgi:ADP-ribose pyrophosphatase YjhB (NUDIX family)